MAEVNVEVGVSAFPARDARFPARLRGDRACPSAANVAVSSRRFAPAHLSRPLRSDTRSPRRRRTPRRARSPWTCRTPRRSRSRWWTPRCSRRSRSCAMSARKPRRPARQRYDSSRDRDTAAMVFLSRSPPRGRRRRQFRCRRGVTRPRGAGNARCARIDRRLRPRGDSGETRAFPARARAPPAARTLSPRSRSRPRARSRRAVCVSARLGTFGSLSSREDS